VPLEFLDESISQEMEYTDWGVFKVFLNPSMQIPGEYLKLGYDQSPCTSFPVTWWEIPNKYSCEARF
jgi:hypothetical protein